MFDCGKLESVLHDWPIYAHVSNTAEQTRVLNSQTYKETHGLFIWVRKVGINWDSQETLVTCVLLSNIFSSEAFYEVISGSPAL